MRKSKIKKILLAICLVFMPFYGYAVGLGQLSVSSGLGEPLNVEIELLSVTPEELSTLSAAIASEDAYAVQGIARFGVHGDIKVDLVKNITGSPVLRLRSSQSISDPYLDILIQVDWASGRLLHEYMILLDPPGYKELISETSEEAGNLAFIQQDEVAATGNISELITSRGDTLNAIAKEMQVEGVSLDQMLIGLFEANKNAFSKSNINQLKVGKIIKAPAKESLMAIDLGRARQAVTAHAASWKAYRNTLADTVAIAPVIEENEQKQFVAGKIASAEDMPTLVKSGSQDVVKLSAGDKSTAKEAKESAGDLDTKISALQEEATAREKVLKESQERTAALEKQIEDMQKLLALKSQTMAEMQKNAETAAKPAEPPHANQAPAPTFLTSLLGGVDLVMVGGASGLALLGAGWMFLRNKRRKDRDSFERSILTSGGLRENTIFGNATGQASASDAQAAEAHPVNAFDFSAISLDLGDNDTQALMGQPSDETSVERTTLVASGNQDVDIKLDLVAAYIDMDDKEGARELLDGVIKEGDPQQRLRAEQLLASLA